MCSLFRVCFYTILSVACVGLGFGLTIYLSYLEWQDAHHKDDALGRLRGIQDLWPPSDTAKFNGIIIAVGVFIAGTLVFEMVVLTCRGIFCCHFCRADPCPCFHKGKRRKRSLDSEEEETGLTAEGASVELQALGESAKGAAKAPKRQRRSKQHGKKGYAKLPRGSEDSL